MHRALILLALSCTVCPEQPPFVLAPTSPVRVGLPAPAASTCQGELMLLTYNVAGLPWGLSSSHPQCNTPRISPLLNHFDLVLMQEDFVFTAELASRAQHPFKTRHDHLFNNGLTIFSSFPLGPRDTFRWRHCHGVFDASSDCMAPKGFSLTTVTLAPGVEVDLYNLHMDSGLTIGDHSARLLQVHQLLQVLWHRSAGRPVIVAGDTNLEVDRLPQDIRLLDQLLASAHLVDACRQVRCPEQGRIDRVMVRGTASLQLRPLSWSVDARFVDDDGEDLSDHKAVAVRIGWSIGGGGGSLAASD